MIVLDYQDRRPIYEQSVEKFRHLILSGALPPGSRMPSVRQLAMDLSINPNTIQRAYRELEMQGWVASVPGKGSFVCGIPGEYQQERLVALEEFDKKIDQLLALGLSPEELIERIKQGGIHHA